MRHFLALGLVLAAACSIDGGGGDRVQVPNSTGKDDSIALRFKLTESNKVVSLGIGCDQAAGCDGHITVRLKSPEPCALFPDEPRCGVARTTPLGLDVLTSTIVSTTEGERRIPLRVESADGTQFTTDLGAAFTANNAEEVELTLEKAVGTPDMTIEVRAEWKSKAEPNAEVDALRTFLATVPGLTYSELGTAMPGYRAFLLQYEQPIDHENPSAGTFKQHAVLHHRAKESPMVLYTSGYALFSQDDMSELGAALQANQLSTEQRWFGSSRPTEVTPASWSYVNIKQAAADHHRFVQALEPFYSGKWLSTGHSKGGMTSVFHRRFYPADIDATVAYVAPISYADPDPRYVPFLDTIGEETCRNAIRAVQKKAFESFAEMSSMAKALHAPSATFERSGGFESAFEKDILALEWAFWQYYTVNDCGVFLTPPTDTAGIFNLVTQLVGAGASDDVFEDSQFMAYQWQAATELGHQSFATSHLDGLLQHTDKKQNQAPAGTMPVHSRAAMDDIQNWVKTEASQVMFIYGGSDPWTGGAYDIAALPEVIKVTAPMASHAAVITSLANADRELVLNKIDQWIGQKPAIGAGSPVPHVPMPWRL